MQILYIDLASSDAVMACVSDQQTLALEHIDARMGDDKLLPVLDALCAKAGWKLDQLTHIACTTGPGGFTSLRIAVALANMLADQLQISLVGIHGSDVYKARVTEQDCLWLHATKKSALFVRGFGSFADQFPEPTLKTVAELLEQLPDQACVVGEILPEQREALSSKKLLDGELRSLEETLPSFLANQPYKQQLVVPWYGRGW